MSRKKLLRRIAKGVVQDALNGTAAPQAAGVFAATGQQSMAPATLGQKLTGNLGPVNGVPGVSATLQGGESPYVIPSANYDETMEKRASKQVRKAAKKAEKQSLLRKAQSNPLEMLSRLEVLAGQLVPPRFAERDPRRIQAYAVIQKARLRMEATAAITGSVAKGVAEAAEVDLASEVAQSLAQVEAALGIAGSSGYWRPPQIDARGQMERIMSGGQSESLRGTQDSRALTAYGSPAAAMGQVLKQTGSGDEIVKAEAAVRAAEATGRADLVSAAEAAATQARFRAEALLSFGGGA